MARTKQDQGPRSAVEMAASPPGDTEDWPSGTDQQARVDHTNRVLGHDQAPAPGVQQAPDADQPGGEGPRTLTGADAGTGG